MAVFIVSDFHLFDRSEPFLFNAKKEDCFVRLCEHVLETDARLLCAGDIFDFSGLSPCEFGQREFFSEAVPSALIDQMAVERSCRKRSTAELLSAIQSAFPRFFAALSSLARAGRLDYLPGNHDCELLSPTVQRLLTDTLEVDPSAIRWSREFIYHDRVIVRHGNEFDAANRTTHSCQNSGKIFTSALYQCVIPALRMLGVGETTLAAIPAVRPEEATLLWLEEKTGHERTKALLSAFVRLLERNGFFSGIARVPAWFLVHDVPFISARFRNGITTERVRQVLPNDEKLMLAARAGARRVRSASRSHLANSLVVLGHTHVLDVQSDYVNLGTWIDHITGLHDQDIEQADHSLPVFYFDPQRGARVFDARGLEPGKAPGDCRTIGTLT